jgi:hypothetical protein
MGASGSLSPTSGVRQGSLPGSLPDILWAGGEAGAGGGDVADVIAVAGILAGFAALFLLARALERL